MSDATDVTHVRQARRGRHAFMILVASTGLALLALFSVLAYRSHDLKTADQQPPSQAAAQQGASHARPTPGAGYPQ
ncbi:MAG TPA: hypothetical protein VF459_20535 [Caulobacteraceae bacterium]